MKLCWLTDIHLNFLALKERKVFYDNVKQQDIDVILITGDITEATSLHFLLKEMADIINKPIYFVLGNHDYYRGDIKRVREDIQELCNHEPLLHWLPMEHRIILTNNTLLFGQDTWADGRYGDYDNSNVVLNDSRFIYDFIGQSKNGLLAKMQEFADHDAKALQNDLSQNIKKNITKIIILLHAVPFEESCLYQGKIGAPDWQPFFTSKIMGDVILAAAQDNPNIDFLVLCGHTHSDAIYQPLSNLLVKTGGAEYHHPKVQEIISV